MNFMEAEARKSAWGNTDGSQTPIVRIYGGKAGKAMVAISYENIPKLIAELAQLQFEHQQKEVQS